MATRECLFIGGPWDMEWRFVEENSPGYEVRRHKPAAMLPPWVGGWENRKRPQCLEQLEIEALVGKQGEWHLPGPKLGPIAEESEIELMERIQYISKRFAIAGQGVTLFIAAGHLITNSDERAIVDKVARHFAELAVLRGGEEG